MVMISKYIEVDVDVEVDMSDFEDDELVAEIRSRNLSMTFNNDLVEKLYWAYTAKNSALTDEYLKELFYQELGKIVV